MISPSIQIFIDLDGVLVDFDSGVVKATGKSPDELHPARMWPALARTTDFYDRLDWMSDGRQLWNALWRFDPAILTGLPRGHWAEKQKRSWCARELDPQIPVITCMSSKKAIAARKWMDEQGIVERTPLLVDDRIQLMNIWEDAGGIFIHHKNTKQTLKELIEVGFEL